MQRITRRTLMAVLTLLGLAGAAAQRAGAEEIFAITARGAGVVPSIFSFDSAAPNAISPLLPLTGIGQDILSIDFRPSSGHLYGTSRIADERLFTIDIATGAATVVAPVRPALSSVALGLDFNPVTDELRAFVNRSEVGPRLNVRLDPDTGAVVQDAPLRYAPGDPNFGSNPNVQGLAYTNNFPGAQTTRLYGIDISNGFLVTAESEDAGTLRSVGRLGWGPDLLRPSSYIGFDISGVTGTAYAAVTPISGPNAFAPQLYTMNLDTGAASFVGAIGAGRTPLPVIGISAAPAVIPEPASLLLVGTGLLGAGIATVRRRRKTGEPAQA